MSALAKMMVAAVLVAAPLVATAADAAPRSPGVVRAVEPLEPNPTDPVKDDPYCGTCV